MAPEMAALATGLSMPSWTRRICFICQMISRRSSQLRVRTSPVSGSGAGGSYPGTTKGVRYWVAMVEGAAASRGGAEGGGGGGGGEGEVDEGERASVRVRMRRAVQQLSLFDKQGESAVW